MAPCGPGPQRPQRRDPPPTALHHRPSHLRVRPVPFSHLRTSAWPRPSDCPCRPTRRQSLRIRRRLARYGPTSGSRSHERRQPPARRPHDGRFIDQPPAGAQRRAYRRRDRHRATEGAANMPFGSGDLYELAHARKTTHARTSATSKPISMRRLISGYRHR